MLACAAQVHVLRRSLPGAQRHAVALRRIAGNSAGQQSERNRKKRKDDENRLGTEHSSNANTAGWQQRLPRQGDSNGDAQRQLRNEERFFASLRMTTKSENKIKNKNKSNCFASLRLPQGSSAQTLEASDGKPFLAALRMTPVRGGRRCV
jgi:hypothetical protein